MNDHGQMRVGRMPFELAWAAVCSPLVAILVALLLEALRESPSYAGVTASGTGFLIPLMFAGMAVLASLIYFDCRAVEVFCSRAGMIRVTQGISAAITMIYLSVAVTADGDQRRASDAAAMVLFLGVPVLIACTGLLWHVATLIQNSLRRGLILVGFVTMTALLELLSAHSTGQNAEERLFMLHSLLVALAFGIHLGIWSTRVLGRACERPVHE